MWRCALVTLLALSVGLHLTQTAMPSDLPPGRIDHDPPLDAKPLIEHCWAISLELRSSQNTTAQRAGALKTALCLEKEVLLHASRLMHDDPYAAPLAETLKQLRSSYSKLYWSIYNDVEACGNRFCGTLFHSFANAELADLYEKILTDIIAQRKRYGTAQN